jgi:hypothetical protein
MRLTPSTLADSPKLAAMVAAASCKQPADADVIFQQVEALVQPANSQ